MVRRRKAKKGEGEENKKNNFKFKPRGIWWWEELRISSPSPWF
jgi:hypothetical protein